AGSLRPSCSRRLATASGVADCPRIEAATSPGRISVPAKISTDTASRRRRPSAMRWAISFSTWPTPSCPRSCLVQPDADCRAQIGGFMVRVLDPALDLLAARVEEIVEHRQDQAAFVTDEERRLAIELGAPG